MKFKGLIGKRVVSYDGIYQSGRISRSLADCTCSCQPNISKFFIQIKFKRNICLKI